MTPEELEARNQKRIQTNIEKYGKPSRAILPSSNPYSRGKRGKRADLDNQYFRSSWEANYARYLRFLKEHGEILDWEYEPETFIFHGVTRNPLSYTPDFKVTELDGSVVYHEIKGWMDSKSRSKLKRMAKFYPDVKIIVIDEDIYKSFRKWAGIIEGWE